MYESDQAYEKRYPKRRIFRNGQADQPGVRSQDSGTDMTECRVGPLGSVEYANIMIHDDEGWDGWMDGSRKREREKEAKKGRREEAKMSVQP